MTTHINSVQLARIALGIMDVTDRHHAVAHLKVCEECMTKAQQMFHDIATDHNFTQFKGCFDFAQSNRIKNMLKAYVKSGAMGTVASNFIKSASGSESVKQNILKVNDVPVYGITYNSPFSVNDPAILTVEILDDAITEGVLFIDDLGDYRECISISSRKMVLLVDQSLEFYDITIQHCGGRG